MGRCESRSKERRLEDVCETQMEE
ncbi:hypothetical protein LINPERHAP1_LOCUS36299 [Linum perenne]